MKLALRITAATLRGTREGVPRLVNALLRHGAGATFLFAVGPDRAGRALFDAPLRRELGVQGLRGRLYGTLLPAPGIGPRCRKTLRRVREEGFDIGVHGWDVAGWCRHAAGADMEWTAAQWHLAWGRFSDLFGEMPHVHGAPGWRMNRHAWRLEQRLGLRYASDTRGTHPFLPVYEGELLGVPQLPTTLPTFAELLRQPGARPDDAVGRLLELVRYGPATGQVFSLSAEREGLAWLPYLERLLEGWRALGCELVSLRQLCESLDHAKLPRCLVGDGTVPGREAPMALQGKPYLDGAAERVMLPDRRARLRPASGYTLPRRVDEPYRPRPFASLARTDSDPG